MAAHYFQILCRIVNIRVHPGWKSNGICGTPWCRLRIVVSGEKPVDRKWLRREPFITVCWGYANLNNVLTTKKKKTLLSRGLLYFRFLQSTLFHTWYKSISTFFVSFFRRGSWQLALMQIIRVWVQKRPERSSSNAKTYKKCS